MAKTIGDTYLPRIVQLIIRDFLFVDDDIGVGLNASAAVRSLMLADCDERLL